MQVSPTKQTHVAPTHSIISSLNLNRIVNSCWQNTPSFVTKCIGVATVLSGVAAPIAALLLPKKVLPKITFIALSTVSTTLVQTGVAIFKQTPAKSASECFHSVTKAVRTGAIAGLVNSVASAIVPGATTGSLVIQTVAAGTGEVARQKIEKEKFNVQKVATAAALGAVNCFADKVIQGAAPVVDKLQIVERLSSNKLVQDSVKGAVSGGLKSSVIQVSKNRLLNRPCDEGVKEQAILGAGLGMLSGTLCSIVKQKNDENTEKKRDLENKTSIKAEEFQALKDKRDKIGPRSNIEETQTTWNQDIEKERSIIKFLQDQVDKDTSLKDAVIAWVNNCISKGWKFTSENGESLNDSQVFLFFLEGKEVLIGKNDVFDRVSYHTVNDLRDYNNVNLPETVACFKELRMHNKKLCRLENSVKDVPKLLETSQDLDISFEKVKKNLNDHRKKLEQLKREMESLEIASAVARKTSHQLNLALADSTPTNRSQSVAHPTQSLPHVNKKSLTPIAPITATTEITPKVKVVQSTPAVTATRATTAAVATTPSAPKVVIPKTTHAVTTTTTPALTATTAISHKVKVVPNTILHVTRTTPAVIATKTTTPATVVPNSPTVTASTAISAVTAVPSTTPTVTATRTTAPVVAAPIAVAPAVTVIPSKSKISKIDQLEGKTVQLKEQIKKTSKKNRPKRLGRLIQLEQKETAIQKIRGY